MIRKEMVINNESGLHARPATLFVRLASQYKSSILVEKDNNVYNAKSIISVLSGGIGKGSQITLVIDGEDEERAAKAITELLNSNFNE